MTQTLIISYSKKQNTVETSTFFSEFIALRIAVEKVIVVRYKLRIFKISFDRPVQIFCDSDSVVKNSSYPESRLNEKHLSCANHKSLESIVAGTIVLFFGRGDGNLVDILTKSLSSVRRKRSMNRLFGNFIL